jgi:signal transduction histidine kinase
VSREWDGLLRRVIEITTTDLKLADMMRHIAELVTDASRSDVCFVHVVEEDRRSLVLAGATPPFDRLAGTIRLRFGEGVAGWVAHRGQPAIVNDKWSDPRYKYIPALKGEEFSSMVSVPLKRHGQRVVGVLNLHSRRSGHFNTEDVSMLLDVAGLLAGVVENAILHTRLERRDEELEQFAARTLELQEMERRRVAGDIHDGISQRLISLWYHLSAASELAGAQESPVGIELTAALELTNAALDEARRTIIGLRPAVLDDLGLGAGLESLVKSLPGVAPEIQIEPCRLAAHVETALFRIAQEALQNVVKHAKATGVDVVLDVDGNAVRLVIADNGQGFATDGATGGYGIGGMHGRAALIGASLDVTSEPGQGTTVTVVVPAPTVVS